MSLGFFFGRESVELGADEARFFLLGEEEGVFRRGIYYG